MGVDGGSDRHMGTLFTETFDYGGGRSVTVFVPSSPPELVVFSGDGQIIAPWGRLLDPAATPAMMVGVHRIDADDEMERLREYSPSIDPERFAAHERFLLNQVRPWVEQRFSLDLHPARTAIHGVSASAELALASGLRHPEIFGTVFAVSPGGAFRPPALLPARLPRVYLLAGDEEPFFSENADRWAVALRAAGADVASVRRAGSHGGPFWSRELPAMVDWALRRPGG